MTAVLAGAGGACCACSCASIIHLGGEVADLMLGRGERGRLLRVLRREVLRDVVFVNCVADEGAAKNHDSSESNHALVGHALGQRSKLHHNAS